MPCAAPFSQHPVLCFCPSARRRVHLLQICSINRLSEKFPSFLPSFLSPHSLMLFCVFLFLGDSLFCMCCHKIRFSSCVLLSFPPARAGPCLQIIFLHVLAQRTAAGREIPSTGTGHILVSALYCYPASGFCTDSPLLPTDTLCRKGSSG